MCKVGDVGDVWMVFVIGYWRSVLFVFPFQLTVLKAVGEEQIVAIKGTSNK